jgi:hypothetical protein
MEPLLTLINIVTGFSIISDRKKKFYIYSALFLCTVILEGSRLAFGITDNTDFQLVRFGFLSLYYTTVTLEIIRQVWFASEVTKNVIFGVMGGYVSLGLIGYFLLLGVEIAEPGSFIGIDYTGSMTRNEDLFYFAYITLMTIGYGDITPGSPLAQKASILIGLLGQFYLVILTAVVVGKYINAELRNR